MDVENSPNKLDKAHFDVQSIQSENTNEVSNSKESRGRWGDFVDGFKRADLDGIDTSTMTAEQIQDHLTANAPLKRDLTSWQVSLIAIGGSIGSGLFIGVGNSFQEGGAGAVVIGFTVMGIMIFCTMQSVGALATAMPVNGSYVYYCSRFVSRSVGCAVAWLYLENWLISNPLEIISSAITISYWDTDNNAATRVNKAAWVGLFYVVIFAINMFGAKGYGWGESILSVTKVIAVLGFCIFGIVVAAGGYPGQYAANHLAKQPNYLYGLEGKYIGAHFWYHPGSFSAGFKGVVNTAVNAAFSYGGSELAALAAAETRNPGKTVPRAIKQVFWRVCLFYVVSLTIVGCLVPYTDDRLGKSQDGRASPFVIAISNANIKALPSIFNVVILLAVLSVGNAGVFASSRTAASLAAQGFAPSWFGYIDRRGRPLVGIGMSAVAGLLCFLAAYDNYYDVFSWMLAISGLSSMFIWGLINLSMVRMYMAMKVQGRSRDELTFEPIGGIFTPILGAFLNLAVICLQFWLALYPIGQSPSAEGFFSVYLSVPIVFVIYIISRLALKEKKWFIRAKDIDLDTGRREPNLEKLIAENRAEKERIRAKGTLYRIYTFWC